MKCSRMGNALRYHVLAAMHCFWLVNHTQGANWETVKQIICPGISHGGGSGFRVDRRHLNIPARTRGTSSTRGCPRRGAHHEGSAPRWARR